MQLQNVAHNAHCTQQNNQFLLNKTAVFQRVGSENSDTKYHKCLHLVFKLSSTYRAYLQLKTFISASTATAPLVNIDVDVTSRFLSNK